MKLIPTTVITAIILGACASNPEVLTTSNSTASGCQMQAYSLFFENGSADFDTAASAKLNTIADAYKGCNLYRIELDGYADSVGSSPSNLELSEQRAQSVLGALSVRGVTADRIQIIPLGEREASIDNTANAFQRKVDVRLIP